LLALERFHTASGEIVGARWVWGQSGHPTLGPVEARFIRGSNSPLVADLAPFDCEDEAYGGMWIAPRREASR
jgi:hypothetical protein